MNEERQLEYYYVVSLPSSTLTNRKRKRESERRKTRRYVPMHMRNSISSLAQLASRDSEEIGRR